MVLLGEEAQVKARFGLFGDSANLDARQVYGLYGMYHILRNQFGRTRQNSQIMCVIWNLASICLETMLVQVQDWCMVCAECTQAQKPLWKHPMIILGEDAQVEGGFDLFGDSANLDARQVHGLQGTYHMLRNSVSYRISLWSLWRQCQFRCKIGTRFVPNAPSAKKLYWTHAMVLLVEEAHVESWFCLFGDSSNLDARQVHGLHGTYYML